MEKRVLVPVADGVEEMEAITIVDVLRRAGAIVTIASVNDIQITASKGVRIIADTTIHQCMDKQYDLIVLPGGIPGCENLRDSEDLTILLKQQAEAEKYYGAICASPAVVLNHHGLLKSRYATCHPAFVNLMDNTDQVDSIVVVDHNCVTSRGAGTALAFSLKLVELLYSRQTAKEVAGPMVAILDQHEQGSLGTN